MKRLAVVFLVLLFFSPMEVTASRHPYKIEAFDTKTRLQVAVTLAEKFQSPCRRSQILSQISREYLENNQPDKGLDLEVMTSEV